MFFGADFLLHDFTSRTAINAKVLYSISIEAAQSAPITFV